MRTYETTFILVPTLDAEGAVREVDAVKKFLASHGGEVTAEKEWGRRRLAYPIRDCSEGIYHILRFTFGTDGLGELDRYFRLNENILRHLVIRDEGTPLETVGQVSESEERDRYSRDDRPGPPYRGRPDRPRASAPAPSEPKPAAVATASEEAPATAPSPGGDSGSTAGGEDSRE